MTKITIQKNNPLLLVFIFLLFVVNTFAQKKVKYDYKLEAKKEKANYYTIIKQKEKEINSYDLTKIDDLKEYKHFNRWAEYWRIRVNADGSFPDENLAYFNAGILNADGKINTLQYAAKSISTENWTNIGAQDIPNTNGYSNYPQMGRLNAFLRIKHPSDQAQDVLFVGAPNGGIWKSTDGGSTWSPKLDMVAGIGVTDIKTTSDATFANYTTKPIYVSTGDWDGGNAKSIGVLKSTDGGETFTSTGLTYTLNQGKKTGDLIVIDENTVIVGGPDNIEKTTDGGTNWAPTYTSGYSNLNFGRAAKIGNQIMYSADVGVFYTSDYTSNNWTEVVAVTDNLGKSAVTVGEDGNFYIQAVNGQVQKFDATGMTFSDFGSIPAGYNAQQGYNQALIVNNDLIISGEFNGTHSTDNGNSWYRSLNGYWADPAGNGTTSDGTYIHSDHHRLGKLEENNLKFWSVNDGGLNYIQYQENGGKSENNSNNVQVNNKPTIEYKSAKTIVTQHYSVAINPSVNNSDDYLVGNQDNDAFSKIDGIWYAVSQGDGIESAINYNDPKIRYATNQNGIITRSDEGFKNELNGDYWVKPQGIPFHHHMELDRSNPNIIYINANKTTDDEGNPLPATVTGLYKVVDDGNQLTATNMDASTKTYKFNTHSGLILAISDNNIIRKIPTNGDAVTSITGTQNLGVEVKIESVDFNASNNNTVYVSTKGYNSKKVFKSIDGGANFTDITGNLPNIIINKILYKQGTSPEIVFVATNVGVYFTSNEGTNWAKLGQGLPNVDVKDIEIQYAADKLVAATFGRGLWDINIADSTLGINKNTLENSLEFSLYPNPVKNGKLKITLKNETNANYEIYNVVGGIVKKGKLNEEININELANNVYLIRVYNNNFSITKKFILAK